VSRLPDNEDSVSRPSGNRVLLFHAGNASYNNSLKQKSQYLNKLKKTHKQLTTTTKKTQQRSKKTDVRGIMYYLLT